MNIKEVNHIDDYVRQISKDLLASREISPRGLKTLEIEDAIMILTNPDNSIITLPARKLNLNYLDAEMQWYKSGDLNINFIKQYSSMWDRIKNPDNTINSNYGYFVFKQEQFNWCLKRLQEDINTRQAIINYNQPIHKQEGTKDFVCTIAQQFRIKDNKLDSRVIMRSNDLIYGFSYDIPWFTYVQKELSNKLNIKVGKYIHNAMSLHVYEKHFKMLEELAYA